MITWREDESVTSLLDKPGYFGWILVIIRVIFLAITILGLMCPLFILRILGLKDEGQKIVQFACMISLKIIGIKVNIQGEPMQYQGGVVANHSSWLDIFTLNAMQCVYFISKSDVSTWPVIGFIARSTGTIFIQRKASEAVRQKNHLKQHLKQGQKLLFFPEGTSSDGLQVLPFRSSLFAAFFDKDIIDDMWIQPVSVKYKAPHGLRKNFYGWWGNMNFGAHFLMVLSYWRQGSVDIIFHKSLRVVDYKDRKILAKEIQNIIGTGCGF